MKIEKYYLGLAIIVGVLCVPVLGEVMHGEPMSGQPNSALTGIDNLYVWMVRHGLEPNSRGLVFEELENSITDRLKKTSIKITETDIDKAGPDAVKMLEILKRGNEAANLKNLKFRNFHIPELCIDIDALYIEHSQQIVFRIRTSLARLAHIENENQLVLKTDVWQSEPAMQAVSAENMPAKVTEVVMEQVEVFIRSWQAANPKGARPAFSEVSPKGGPVDANQARLERSRKAAIRQKEPAQPPATAAATKYPYVASKNSKVFHKSTCSSAKKISPENLVHYKTREDAINAGKRPCKMCKP